MFVVEGGRRDKFHKGRKKINLEKKMEKFSDDEKKREIENQIRKNEENGIANRIEFRFSTAAQKGEEERKKNQWKT